MTLAIFDLDNTLIAGDSDHLWGDWLVARGIINGATYKATNDRFLDDYQQGKLDIQAYLEFALKVLAEHDVAQLSQWRTEFFADMMPQLWLPKAQALVDKHREQGHTLMIITATNDFVTAPLAEKYGIPHLLATQAEQLDGQVTGRVSGIPSFREGKVTRLNQWLADNKETLTGSWFYSDSLNDLPLLEQVDNPVAVDPDDTLADIAKQNDWPILSLRKLE